MQFASAAASVRTFIPCLRLRSETLLIDQSEGFGEDFREVESAVIEDSAVEWLLGQMNVVDEDMAFDAVVHPEKADAAAHGTSAPS